MSTFFTALEQAKRDRALKRTPHRRQDGTAASGPVAADGRPTPRAPVEPAAVHGESLLSYAKETTSRAGVDAHLVSLLSPASFQAEPYRALRHLVEQLHRTAQLRTVAVSSAGVGDGKTTTAINLAGALAQAPDARILLVDADLRNSSIARQLALPQMSSRGLVDAILDPNLGLDDVVISMPSFNLHILPAGAPTPKPYEILQSPRLGDLMGEAHRRYDYVVVDTAPLLPVPDTRLIGKWIDGYLVVVAAHKTARKLLGEALNLLDRSQVIGLVFNEDDDPGTGHFEYSAYDPAVKLPSSRSSRVRRRRPWFTGGRIR